MTTATTVSITQGEPELLGQTVAVIVRTRTAPRAAPRQLSIGRVVGPADVAALAVHIMSNTALTGATYDIDGGQQLVPGH